MKRDVLSEVLRHIRLRGAVYYNVSAGDAWAAEAPHASEIADMVMPGAEHVFEYHIVTRGSCWGGIVDEPPVHLVQGDIILFPQGDPHVLSSGPGMRADPARARRSMARGDQQLPFTLHLNDSGPNAEQLGASIICGFLGCDLRPFNPLITALPRQLHLPSNGESSWTTLLMQHAVAESTSPRAGGEAMLECMSEMMFVDAVRRYAETLPAGGTGWFAALRDRLVGRALTLLHADPAAAWTVDELGRSVGLSRSALHQRFVEMIGQPPMQYLGNWRMQMATSMLRSTNATVSTIAQDVGYESEAAFSRAFRRMVGTPPAAWRRLSNTSDVNAGALEQ